MLRQLLRDRRGASLVEYIVLIGVVGLLSMLAFKKFGWTLRGKIDDQTVQVEGDDPLSR